MNQELPDLQFSIEPQFKGINPSKWVDRPVYLDSTGKIIPHKRLSDHYQGHDKIYNFDNIYNKFLCADSKEELEKYIQYIEGEITYIESMVATIKKDPSAFITIYGDYCLKDDKLKRPLKFLEPRLANPDGSSTYTHDDIQTVANAFLIFLKKLLEVSNLRLNKGLFDPASEEFLNTFPTMATSKDFAVSYCDFSAVSLLKSFEQLSAPARFPKDAQKFDKVLITSNNNSFKKHFDYLIENNCCIYLTNKAVFDPEEDRYVLEIPDLTTDRRDIQQLLDCKVLSPDEYLLYTTIAQTQLRQKELNSTQTTTKKPRPSGPEL